MLRVFVADDHEIVRHGVRDLVNSHPGWEVCGEAEDGQTAYELAIELKPDVIVLDVSMARLNGVTLARILRQELPNASVLLFTMRDDRETVNSALGVGVRGYVLKSEGEAELFAAITALAARRSYFSPTVTDLVVDTAISDHQTSSLENFTTRELEVAQLIAEGQNNKAIARAMDLSVKTVESHRSAALRKAGVHTAAALVRFAIRHNLILA